MTKIKTLKQKALQLPTNPGVYIYKNNQQQIVYVGKAKNLRKRVSSYFNKIQDFKTSLLLEQINEIEYMITPTEIDALVLEDQLISKHQPRYNVLLKHDSSYRYICITRTNPPKITTSRKLYKNQICLGPFPFATHEIVKVARDILGLTKYQQLARTTWQNYLDAANFHKNSNDQFLDETKYQNFINKLIKIIKHGDQTLIDEYQKLMIEFAKKEEYEQALQYRERIELLTKVRQRTTQRPSFGSEQLVYETEHQNQSFIFVFEAKNGLLNLLKKFSFNTQNGQLNILNSFIKQYYTNHEPPQKLKIYSDDHQELDQMLAQYLTNIWQKKIIINKITKKDRLLTLAHQNIQAKLQIKNLLTAQLKQLFGLKNPPETIDFVDISNLSDTVVVGGVVRFINGLPIKNLWRHYTIKTVIGQNDYASITETINRRYQKINLPDVLVVDGGLGQLNAALKALPKNCPTLVVGLAKSEETLIFDNGHSNKLSNQRKADLFIIKGRDTIHNFVIEHSRQKFKQIYKKSWLDEMPGIGSATKLKLIKHFKSIEKIKESSEAELIKAIGKSKAKIILDALKTHASNSVNTSF